MQQPSLSNWLSYSDRDHPPLFPIHDGYVTTHLSGENRPEEMNHPNYRREDFVISSALINQADAERARAVSWGTRDLDIHPGWNDDGSFDFGISAQSHGIEIIPWVHIWRHPITNVLHLRIRPDFEIYHALKSKDGDRDILIHPLDRIAALRWQILEFDLTESSPGMQVHEHYLRDYLAARGLALVIGVVCDRFANAPTREGLGVQEVEDDEIAPSTELTIDIREPGGRFETAGLYSARSTLWRTIVVEPLASPNHNGTPWHIPRDPREKPDLPSGFKVDGEGTIGTLRDAHRLSYLDFRPSVLQKYLANEGYGVRFHMRHWGVAWSPGGDTMDLGFNNDGVLNAFVPDLLRQRPEEQAHWVSFSVPKTGCVCEEMFQTRMMLKPPISPSMPEMLKSARESLAGSFTARFGTPLYEDSFVPDGRQWQRLSVGPVTEEVSELLELAKITYRWLIESMNTKSLRHAIDNTDLFEKGWKQIKLIEVLLTAVAAPEKERSQICAAMKSLNKLRVDQAHLISGDRLRLAEEIDGCEESSSLRKMWLALADRTAQAFRKCGDCLQAK